MNEWLKTRQWFVVLGQVMCHNEVRGERHCLNEFWPLSGESAIRIRDFPLRLVSSRRMRMEGGENPAHRATITGLGRTDKEQML